MGHTALLVVHGIGAQERGVGVDERLLHGVLGARLGEEASGEARERLAIPRDDRVEGALVSFTHELDESLV